MECSNIKEKLSAYIEDILSSEEKKQIDDHLKACSKCSSSFEELEKTIAYVRGLEEVEPPPWLTQKVMTGVREEAEQKKGILQKLFYPLHIKIPIEVIATIAMVVTAFYIFKTIEPEMRFAKAPSEEIVVSEHEEKESTSIKNEFLAYKDKEVLSETRGPAKKQRLGKEPDVSARKTETQKAPAALAGGRTIPRGSNEDLAMEAEKAERFSPVSGESDAYGYKKDLSEFPEPAEQPEPLREQTASVPAVRQDEVMPSAGVAARDESKREVLPPAPELKAKASKLDIKEDMVLTLYVEDIAKSMRKTGEIIKGLGGEVVEIESFENKDVLTVTLGYKKMKELNEKLGLIGEVKKKESLDGLKATLTIKINIVKMH